MVERQFGTDPADHTDMGIPSTIWPVCTGVTKVLVVTLSHIVVVTRYVEVELALNIAKVVIQGIDDCPSEGQLGLMPRQSWVDIDLITVVMAY